MALAAQHTNSFLSALTQFWEAMETNEPTKGKADFLHSSLSHRLSSLLTGCLEEFQCPQQNYTSISGKIVNHPNKINKQQNLPKLLSLHVLVSPR